MQLSLISNLMISSSPPSTRSSYMHIRQRKSIGKREVDNYGWHSGIGIQATFMPPLKADGLEIDYQSLKIPLVMGWWKTPRL